MTNKPTLTELCDRFYDLDETVDDLDLNTLPPELKEALDDLLENRDIAKEAYYAKINSILNLIKNRESWAKIRRDRIFELKRLIEIDNNLARNLNGYLLQHLSVNNINKLRTTDYNISISKNGGKQPVVVDPVDPDTLPDDLTVTERKVNKNAVRDRLLAGEKLSFARLGDRGQHLRIK